MACGGTEKSAPGLENLLAHERMGKRSGSGEEKSVREKKNISKRQED